MVILVEELFDAILGVRVRSSCLSQGYLSEREACPTGFRTHLLYCRSSARYPQRYGDSHTRKKSQ